MSLITIRPTHAYAHHSHTPMPHHTITTAPATAADLRFKGQHGPQNVEEDARKDSKAWSGLRAQFAMRIVGAAHTHIHTHTHIRTHTHTHTYIYTHIQQEYNKMNPNTCTDIQ